VKKLRERTSLDKAEVDVRPLKQISLVFSMSSWSARARVSDKRCVPDESSRSDMAPGIANEYDREEGRMNGE
jgi:hypothetical protein